MRRTFWYEPRLDPIASQEYAERAAYGMHMPERVLMDEDEVNEFSSGPNLIGSLVEGDILHDPASFHMPVIDFDGVPMRLVPSSTPGNFQLYIDKAISWNRYKKILQVLADAGLVEDEYVNASIRQGSTFVRPESVKKVIWHPDEVSFPVSNLPEANLVSGACCGDPGDCTHECGMGRH